MVISETGKLYITVANYGSDIETVLYSIDAVTGALEETKTISSTYQRPTFGVPVLENTNLDYIISGWSQKEGSETVPGFLGFSGKTLTENWEYILEGEIDVHTVLWNNVISSKNMIVVLAEEEVNRNQLIGFRYGAQEVTFKMGWIMLNRYLAIDKSDNVYFFNATEIYKLDAETGKIIVGKEIDAGSYGLVDGYYALAFSEKDDLVFLHGESNLARARKASDLSASWETLLTNVPEIVCSNPAVPDDESKVLFLCGGFFPNNSTLFVLDPPTGTITKKVMIENKNCVLEGRQGMVVLTDGRYVLGCEKEIYLMNQNDQLTQTVEIVKTEGSVMSMIADSSNCVYVSYTEGASFKLKKTCF